MTFFNEYALLFAVAIPVVAIVGLQVFLAITGESGTGLLPGLTRYPSIEIGRAAESLPVPQPVVDTQKRVETVESSNDEEERLAA